MFWTYIYDAKDYITMRTNEHPERFPGRIGKYGIFRYVTRYKDKRAGNAKGFS